MLIAELRHLAEVAATDSITGTNFHDELLTLLGLFVCQCKGLICCLGRIVDALGSDAAFLLEGVESGALPHLFWRAFCDVATHFDVWQAIPNPPSEAFADGAQLIGSVLVGWVPGVFLYFSALATAWAIRRLRSRREASG